VPLGNGIFGTHITNQTVETTVLAGDGETSPSRLIQKSDKKNENKVPWLGDLPYLAPVPLPHPGEDQDRADHHPDAPHRRSPLGCDRILGRGGERMDWIIGDVIKNAGLLGGWRDFARAAARRGPLIPRKRR